MKKLTHLSVKELCDGYSNKEFSVQEVTKEYLEQISRNDKTLGVYITAIENPEIPENTGTSSLYGVPYSLKDNILTKGIKTTCASVMLSEFIPPYSASVHEKLNACGAILLGKTNMDEFAMGSSTENSSIKLTRSPLNFEYVPGGSSGGSAASVAGFEAAFSLGSDTGGSICQPASFCSVVGLNPTYGLVSRYGLIGFAPGFDRIGAITRTVYDSALVLSEIAFFDAKDSTSENIGKNDYTVGIEKGVSGMKIGVISEFLSDGADSEITSTVKNAAKAFENLGANVEEISIPNLSHSAAVYLILSSSEAYSTLSRYDGIRYGFTPDEKCPLDELYTVTRSRGFGNEVKRRLLSGSVFYQMSALKNTTKEPKKHGYL